MNTKIKLQEEIKFLAHDLSYDIDQAHHQERMRILKQKKEELKNILNKLGGEKYDNTRTSTKIYKSV